LNSQKRFVRHHVHKLQSTRSRSHRDTHGQDENVMSSAANCQRKQKRTAPTFSHNSRKIWLNTRKFLYEESTFNLCLLTLFCEIRESKICRHIKHARTKQVGILVSTIYLRFSTTTTAGCWRTPSRHVVWQRVWVCVEVYSNH